MDFKNLTRDIIALLIVIGALVSLFFPILSGADQFLRVVAGVVIGFYFGVGQIPTFGFGKSK